MSDDQRRTMTTAAGNAVGDNQNSLTAGPRGPVLVDPELMERMAHFNRERVPERVVHAKGGAAYGTVTVTHDLSRYTSNPFFATAGSEAECFLRFSTVAGEQGFPDTARDPRGWALKVYTPDGNWDMVGNNTPVFFVRDPLKFQDFIHSQKRDPRTGRRSDTMQWDFWSLSPESLHQVTWLMGDRGLPRSWRTMDGFSSHAYSLWNGAGERYWVKWHFKTQQGIECLPSDEAETIAGHTHDYHRQDLYEAIERGEFPRWTIKVQVMPEAEAERYKHDPFDLTKVWNYEDHPLIEVGTVELNRNPENFFAEVEQAAFEPNNFPVGMGASPDRMLQARLLSYADAHRYRIGINYGALPVNKPRCPVHTYHRDGQTRFDDNGGAGPNYEPNSFGGPIEDPRAKEPPLRLSGDADRHDHRQDHDDFQQAGDLFRLMDEDAKGRLVENIVGGLGNSPKEIQLRQLGHFHRADPDYAARVARALGIEAEFTPPNGSPSRVMPAEARSSAEGADGNAAGTVAGVG